MRVSIEKFSCEFGFKNFHASLKNKKVSASISIAPDSCEFDNIPESCEFQSLISASFEVCLSLASFILRVWHYSSSCEFGSKFLPASSVPKFGSCEF